MNDTPRVGEPLVVVEGLRKTFTVKVSLTSRHRAQRVAVDGIDFTVFAGETLGLIGESGSGKSTTGLCVLRLIDPSAGSIRVGGVDLMTASRSELHAKRREMQIVFQNPYASLNPRMRIGESIAEPLVAHRIGTRRSRKAKAAQLLEQVGLDPAVARYHPQEFSGGERQRIGIARALALEPQLIVCDEAVSALDVSVQAQIINLLRDLQDEHGLTYLFISHDLAVVRAMSDRIAVMKDGRIVELGASEDVCLRPKDPYTARLIEAAFVDA